MMAAEARARVGALRAVAKVGVARARVEAETAMAVEAMAMAVMAVEGGCEGLHTVGAVRARVAVGKAAVERAEPEDAMAAVARASLCSRRSRYSPSRRSRRRLRPWFGPACSRHPERHTRMGKGRHVRTLSSSVDPRSSETAGGSREASEAREVAGKAGAAAVGAGGAVEGAAMAAEARARVGAVMAAARVEAVRARAAAGKARAAEEKAGVAQEVAAMVGVARAARAREQER